MPSPSRTPMSWRGVAMTNEKEPRRRGTQSDQPLDDAGVPIVGQELRDDAGVRRGPRGRARGPRSARSSRALTMLPLWATASGPMSVSPSQPSGRGERGRASQDGLDVARRSWSPWSSSGSGPRRCDRAAPPGPASPKTRETRPMPPCSRSSWPSADGDAGALLPAVLDGEEGEVGLVGDLGVWPWMPTTPQASRSSGRPSTCACSYGGSPWVDGTLRHAASPPTAASRLPAEPKRARSRPPSQATRAASRATSRGPMTRRSPPTIAEAAAGHAGVAGQLLERRQRLVRRHAHDDARLGLAEEHDVIATARCRRRGRPRGRSTPTPPPERRLGDGHREPAVAAVVRRAKESPSDGLAQRAAGAPARRRGRSWAGRPRARGRTLRYSLPARSAAGSAQQDDDVAARTEAAVAAARQVRQQAQHADDGRGPDGPAARFVVEAHVPAHDRDAEGLAGLRHALDDLGQLVVHGGVVGRAEVQAVGERRGARRPRRRRCGPPRRRRCGRPRGAPGSSSRPLPSVARAMPRPGAPDAQHRRVAARQDRPCSCPPCGRSGGRRGPGWRCSGRPAGPGRRRRGRRADGHVVEVQVAAPRRGRPVARRDSVGRGVHEHGHGQVRHQPVAARRP